MDAEGEFSRGRGLQLGALSRPEHALLFMVDIDMAFSSQLLYNIIHNTKPGRAYMPVIFSQYKTREDTLNNLLITTQQGFWRSYGYGMVSIYKEDFVSSGGYDLEIVGWGMEDVRFCDQLIKRRAYIYHI